MIVLSDNMPIQIDPILNSDVIIVGEFSWPHGSAAANILHGHCKAIRNAGFSVALLPSRTTSVAGNSVVEATPYRTFGTRYERSGSRLKHFIAHHFGGADPRLSWLERQNLSNIKAFIAYTGPSGSSSWLLRLRRLCRENRIKLLVYVVEWFDSDHYRGGRWGIYRWDGEVQRRWVNKLVDGVICISSDLHKYYENDVPSVCIPPILDYDDERWKRVTKNEENGKIRILFSGTPKRERHRLLLEALLKVRKHYPNLFIEYLGSSKHDLVGLDNVTDDLISKLGDGVHFHGRVSDEMVDSIISSVSFGIVCRDKAHWSDHCFPSKVPEFIGFGVPMIFNSTSDLDAYLIDGENAIRIESLTLASVEDALFRAARMSVAERKEMSQNARELSRCFDGGNFAGEYHRLLTS